MTPKRNRLSGREKIAIVRSSKPSSVEAQMSWRGIWVSCSDTTFCFPVVTDVAEDS
jgi:hypothetical protein